MRQIKIILVCFLVIIGNSGCAYLSYLKDPFSDIPAFYKVDKGLFRGGQPNLEGWKKLKNLGIKTVIDLRTHDVTKEKRLVSKLGMYFISIPLNRDKPPTDKQSIKFLKIVTNRKRQPIFVHCFSGRDRTGAMIAMYRIVIQGWTPDKAYREALNIGFWRGNKKLKQFIYEVDNKKIYLKAIRKN